MGVTGTAVMLTASVAFAQTPQTSLSSGVLSPSPLDSDSVLVAAQTAKQFWAKVKLDMTQIDALQAIDTTYARPFAVFSAMLQAAETATDQARLRAQIHAVQLQYYAAARARLTTEQQAVFDTQLSTIAEELVPGFLVR